MNVFLVYCASFNISKKEVSISESLFDVLGYTLLLSTALNFEISI
jgi:hypothetical protein